MMGVSSCVSLRQARGSCHCPACPRASGHGASMPPQTLVIPPMALEAETTPVKDKKGSKMKVLKKIKKKIGLAACYMRAPSICIRVNEKEIADGAFAMD
ncbi:unnamed protein product [Euphydryas editha]|uniref:Uncharacterized protein n=1 Tax=Euphydryas editha TaxID=104508 RepID=A0AAU9UPL5_EUPED|nr:unnamed protein product [Euphydryas editha]